MDAVHRKRRLVISRISAPKPYDILADQLRESILRGEISEGESLPTERDIVAQTGLSRGAVREALRLLSAEGLIHTRPGRSGGNIVTLPGNESMASAVCRFVRGRRLPLRVLQETREVLEPALARLPALHRTEENVRELRALHDDLMASVSNFQEFSLVDIRWHNSIEQRCSFHDIGGRPTADRINGQDDMANAIESDGDRDQVDHVRFGTN